MLSFAACPFWAVLGTLSSTLIVSRLVTVALRAVHWSPRRPTDGGSSDAAP